MIDYNFYLERDDRGRDFVKTPGIDFQAPIRLVGNIGRFQVWHKPSATVWQSRAQRGTDPAFYVVIATRPRSAEEVAHLGKDWQSKKWLTGKQQGEEYLCGNNWRAARAAAIAEAKRLNRLEHTTVGHSEPLAGCSLCDDKIWDSMRVKK